MTGKQRGITLLGFLMVLIVVGIFAFVAMRLFPVYSEFLSVRSDMQSVADEPGSSNRSLAEVRSQLEKRFYVSYVENVNLKEHLKLERTGNVQKMTIAYEVRKPLAYNLDFVAKFDHTVEMNK